MQALGFRVQALGFRVQGQVDLASVNARLIRQRNSSTISTYLLASSPKH